jgi:beta-1,4-N-acetylglucosaminyltransferase
MLKSPNMAIVYGSGGHQEQAKRLHAHFEGYVNDFLFIHDVAAKPIVSNKGITIPEFRDKYNYFKTIKNISLLPFIVIKVIRTLRESNIDILVSPGPGCTILPALIARFMDIRVVYIESWSRFYKLSITGKVMKYIATDFWVQNEELIELDDSFLWVGRL